MEQTTGRPPPSGVNRLLRRTSEDWYVLAGEDVDAFEGPAVGVEVPEVAGHGGGEAAYRVPEGGQVSESGLSQYLHDALPSPACNGHGHPHPGCATSQCKGGCRRKAQPRRFLLAEGPERQRHHPVPLPLNQECSDPEEREV